MKIIIKTLCVFVATVTILNLSLFTRKLAELKIETAIKSSIDFDSLEVDFGDIDMQRKSVDCLFQFINNVGSPIRISRIVSSCGCTIGEYSEGWIATGQASSINLKYFPVTRNYTGPVGTSAVVVFEGAAENKFRLHLKGNIVQYVSVIPNAISFGAVHRDTDILKTIKIKNNTTESFRIVDVISDFEGIEIIEEENTNNIITEGEYGVIRIKSNFNLPDGDYSGSIILKTDSRLIGNLSVPVHFTVNAAGVAVLKDSVAFGFIGPNEKRERSIVLKSLDTIPFRVTKISSCDMIDANNLADDSKSEHTVELILDSSGMTNGIAQGEIVVAIMKQNKQYDIKVPYTAYKKSK